MSRIETAFCLLYVYVCLSPAHARQLAMLIPFSFFGQMACGAVFGIVPFLSHRRSGLTVGVVAAGGNVGAAAMQVGGGGVLPTKLQAGQQAKHPCTPAAPAIQTRLAAVAGCG